MKKLYVVSILLLAIIVTLSFSNVTKPNDSLDAQLFSVLQSQQYTGEIQKQLELKLGRRLDKNKIELGRLIFFDKGLGLHQDNSCSGCHAPGFGFGDSQPIAIGVNNNDTVGVHRRGIRNQRRSPSVINTAFYPSLMWNSRFKSLTNDPFNNSLGYEFPSPEGDSLFSIDYNYVNSAKHLLVAQAHIPFTELPEMAGFTNTANRPIAFSRFSGLNKTQGKALIFQNSKNHVLSPSATCIDPDFSPFDDGQGFPVPPVDPHYNSQNFGIRAEVLALLNNNPTYVKMFRDIYPEVAHHPINFIMVGEVVAEFEFFLTFATAPIDKFAVGKRNAMTNAEKRGALLFFGKANCVTCHAVKGAANEMFSDFAEHNVGTPQVHPVFGAGTGDVPFSDVNCVNKSSTGTLDYGREEFSGNSIDRYRFRSSPLRNAKLQRAFFHNGSFNDLEKAIVYHLNPVNNISTYSPSLNGVPSDLHYRASDMPAVMATIDPVLQNGVNLSENEINDLYLFVRDGLYDDNASPEKMKKLIPKKVPSGVSVAFFEDRETGNLHPENNTNVLMAKEGTSEDLTVKIYSNPTHQSFRIVLDGKAENKNMRLIISNSLGRVVETRSGIVNGQVLTLGQNYQQGIYMARLENGREKYKFKLIKL